MPTSEMTAKAKPMSMDPTIRSNKTDLKSLKVQTLVMAIQVLRSHDFLFQVAIRSKTGTKYENLAHYLLFKRIL